MKLKGNGGYQIIDFESQAPNTLDVDFFGNVIARGKPLWVSNLVVDGETYSGVASIKKTLTHIILVIATIQIVIALSDGATTYEESGDCNVEVITCDTTTISQDDLTFILGKTKPCILKTKAYYDQKEDMMVYGEDYNYYFLNVVETAITFDYATPDGVRCISIAPDTGIMSSLGIVSFI